MLSWDGVFPSVLTPFDAQGRVDFAAFERHIGFLAASGVHGLIVCSTLGEAPGLDDAERRDVLAAAVSIARPHGVPVVAALVESAPNRRRRFAAGLRDAGAAGMLLFPPMLYRATEAELADYLRATIEEAGLPTMVFNKPAAFGCDFSPRLAESMAQLSLLQGVKEAAELTTRVPEWLARHGDRLSIFAGDEFALEAMALGARGFVAGLGNVVPAESAALYGLCRSGTMGQAQALYRALAPLYLLDVSAQLVQNIKLAANIAHGFPEHVRSPRSMLQGAERDRVGNVVREALRALAARTPASN